jgi:endonuclease/exonuclease/phosphatase family metal-dependent hydrolase
MATDAAIIALQEVRYDIFQEIESVMQRQLGGQAHSDISGFRSRFQIDAIVSRFTNHSQSNAPVWQFVYEPSMTYLELHQRRFHVDEGLAFLSKYPILESSALRLTRDFADASDDHHRSCLRIKVQIPCASSASTASAPPSVCALNVFNTHLSLSATARRRTVVEIWQWIVQFDGPSVLVGDLNATPDDDAIRFLTGQLELEGAKGDFRDAWQTLYSNSDIAELKQGFTFFSWEPTKRIDFVLVRGNIDIQSMQRLGMVSSKLVPPATQQQIEEQYASDHYGLSAVLSLPTSTSESDTVSTVLEHQSQSLT